MAVYWPGLDDAGFNARQERQIFLSSVKVQTDSKAQPVSYSKGTGIILFGSKAAGEGSWPLTSA